MTETGKSGKDLFFRSSGKILLSGEYLVLEGAKAFALPLQYGQSLEVVQQEMPGSQLHWQTWWCNRLLLDMLISLPAMKILEYSGTLKADALVDILRAARQLNPGFLQQHHSLKAVANLDFNVQWGFGSSSTLVSNIAWWSNTDPYELNKQVFGGSGYDIACARASGPLLYQLKDGRPLIETVDFYPEFRKNLYLVYSNRKQDSRQAIRSFRGKDSNHCISRISEISVQMTNAISLQEFEGLMDEHESLLSEILGQKPLKQQFADFPGSMKSLGAWGGDCWLVSWNGSQENLIRWFSNKGFQILFPLNRVMLTPNQQHVR